MFKWYRKSAKCYVYLTDVSFKILNYSNGNSQPNGKPIPEKQDTEKPWMQSFMESRWFTRGWTLQELLAPKTVEFFSREGEKLGDKQSLELYIHQVTGIDIAALRGRPLSWFSPSTRIEWARRRRTRRSEDRVYSLLGIFNIHMALIYGEGYGNAYVRLHAILEETARRRSRALEEAVSQNNDRKVRRLLDLGASLHSSFYRGNPTSLRDDAISHGNVGMLKIALDHGADVRFSAAQLGTIIFKRKPRIEKLLLSAAIPAIPLGIQKEKDMGAAMFWATYNGDKRRIEYLLDKGADPNQEDEWGLTPLFWASAHGDDDIVEWLLKRGAKTETDAVRHPGNFTKGCFRTRCVGPYIGACVESQWSDFKGCMSPLWVASHRGHTEVVDLLLQHGVHLSPIEGVCSWTPLALARQENHERIEKLIMKAYYERYSVQARMVNVLDRTLFFWTSELMNIVGRKAAIKPALDEPGQRGLESSSDPWKAQEEEEDSAYHSYTST